VDTFIQIQQEYSLQNATALEEAVHESHFTSTLLCALCRVVTWLRRLIKKSVLRLSTPSTGRVASTSIQNNLCVKYYSFIIILFTIMWARTCLLKQWNSWLVGLLKQLFS